MSPVLPLLPSEFVANLAAAARKAGFRDETYGAITGHPLPAFTKRTRGRRPKVAEDNPTTRATVAPNPLEPAPLRRLFYWLKTRNLRPYVYTAARNRCSRANTLSLPNTRKILVMLGPAFVPVTARRDTAW